MILLIGFILLIIFIVILVKWVKVYNQFNQWTERVKRKFADVKVAMQQRITMMDSLAQIAKQYGSHEFGSFKEVTEARSKWTKDPRGENTQEEINKEVKDIQGVEANWMKLQAVFEKYPELKANAIYQSMMGSDNISNIETRYREAAKEYNGMVEKYNYYLKRFPTSLIANFHNFERAEYISFDVGYESKTMFSSK